MHTPLFGVNRPAPESCDERVKWEPEPKPKSKKYEWESKRVEDLEMSDFSMYDDDIEPFMFICKRFIYKNKAQIQKDKEIEVAMAEYDECSRNLSVSNSSIYLSIYFNFVFNFIVLCLNFNNSFWTTQHNTGVRCYPRSKNLRKMWRCRSPSYDR